MEERERNGRLSPEIYVYATNKNFLNLYDALRIDKVKLEIAGYDPATNRQTGHATAWLDLDDARLLTHLVSHRLFAAVTGGKWEKYGGSQRDDGSIESRVMSVEWDEGENGRFARFPYRLTIANGPGKRTNTGGVSPDGPAGSLMSMRLPESDMIKVMLALGDYIHAYEAAHHHRIVADRVRELREKLAERSERFERSQPASDRPAAPATRPARAPQASGPVPLQALPGGARRPAQPEAARDRARLTPLRGERAERAV
jgi:hypothetical protein